MGEGTPCVAHPGLVGSCSTLSMLKAYSFCFFLPRWWQIADRDRNADDVLAFGNELNDNPDFDFAHRVLDQRNRDQYFGNSNFDHKLAYGGDWRKKGGRGGTSSEPGPSTRDHFDLTRLSPFLLTDRDADSYQQFSYGNEFFSFANRDQLFDYGNGGSRDERRLP